MNVLDKIDLAILAALDEDCRTPHSEIARKIRKSPQYVKYRIDRLQEEKIIKGVTLYAPLQENIREYLLLIKLRGSSVLDEKIIIDFLFKLPQTYRLYYADGAYDIMATFLLKENKERDVITEQLTTNFAFIASVTWELVADSTVFSKKYLGEHPSTIHQERGEPQEKLLQALQRTPFASLLEIAKATGETYDSIKYQFRSKRPYMASQLILSERYVKKALVFITLRKDAARLASALAVAENVTQLDSITGTSTHLLTVECLEGQDAKRIIKALLYEFRDAITDTIFLDVIQTYKHRREFS